VVREELHDEIGHRGRVGMYNHVPQRYQWKAMYSDVDDWVRSSKNCDKSRYTQRGLELFGKRLVLM
jgi:hypothetical protein